MFFAPNSWDAALNESDINSELREPIAAMRVTSKDADRLAFRAIGLLGVLRAEGPEEQKAELTKAFTDSVFDSGETTIAREGTTFLVLEDEDKGGNDGRTLRKLFENEFEQWTRQWREGI